MLKAVFAAVLAVSVAGPVLAAPEEAPQSALDVLTLSYLNHKVYAGGAVACEPVVIGERSYAGCWNETMSGKSSPHLWEYSNGDFLALNGPARSLAEGKFAGDAHIKSPSLPLPSDIDFGALNKAFR